MTGTLTGTVDVFSTVTLTDNGSHRQLYGAMMNSKPPTKLPAKNQPSAQQSFKVKKQLKNLIQVPEHVSHKAQSEHMHSCHDSSSTSSALGLSSMNSPTQIVLN